MRSILLALLLSFSLIACTGAQGPSFSKASGFLDDDGAIMARAEREQALLEERCRFYRDPEIESYLEGLSEAILPPRFAGETSFKFRIIKNPYMNAFAFPNGVVYIHSGMLARMENEAQLAVVLAHEMAHVARKHSMRAHARRQNEEIAGSWGVAGSLGPSGPGNFDIDASDGFTREFEYEADKTAFEWVLRAGYDPHEALCMLERLKAESDEVKGAEPFVGNHPALERRIERYQVFLNGRPEKKKGLRNEEIFLSKMSRLILDNASLDLKAGRFHTASAGVGKYLRSSPNDPRAHYLMGEIHRQRAASGDVARAIEEYKLAISLDPFYPDPQEAIGIVYFKMGRKELAKRHLEACLSLAPETPDKAYILGYLKHCNR